MVEMGPITMIVRGTMTAVQITGVNSAVTASGILGSIHFSSLARTATMMMGGMTVDV